MSPAVSSTADRRRARALRMQGFSAPEIGRLLGGVSESTVRNWWRASECSDCGEPTGDAEQLRCLDCRKAYEHEHMKWTREVVIDAIQRYAALHGRPPASTEWIRSDPAHGYPSIGSVYRSGPAHNSAPFASWADAIEAAGFPRPLQYHYERVGLVGLGCRQRELLAALEARSPQRLRELVGLNGVTRSAVCYSLRLLVGRGLVVKVGHGLYALAEPVVEEAA